MYVVCSERSLYIYIYISMYILLLFARFYLYIRFRLSLWRRARPGLAPPWRPGRATNSPVSPTHRRGLHTLIQPHLAGARRTPTTLHACMHSAQGCIYPLFIIIDFTVPVGEFKIYYLSNISHVAFQCCVLYSEVTARLRAAASRVTAREILVKAVRGQL